MTQLTRTLPLFFGVGIVAIAASVGMASSDTNSLRCDIAEQNQNGMRTITGSVFSPQDVSGEYRFAIRSASNGNSSNISQGGAFSAPANEAVPVGQMMINADARYSVDFSIIVGGQTVACTQNGARFT